MHPNNSLSLLYVATVLSLATPALTSAGPVADLAREIEQFTGELHPASRQIPIPGANHYYDDFNDELSAAISGWLETLPALDQRRVTGA